MALRRACYRHVNCRPAHEFHPILLDFDLVRLVLTPDEPLDSAGNLISGAVRLRKAWAGLALAACGNSASCRGFRPYDSVSQLTPETRCSQGSSEVRTSRTSVRSNWECSAGSACSAVDVAAILRFRKRRTLRRRPS